jgi:hypothetical protein
MDLLTQGVSILVFIAARVAPIVLVILIFIFLLQKANKRRIEFIKERFYEPTKIPVDSEWGIRILYPIPTMKEELNQIVAGLCGFRKRFKRMAQKLDLKTVRRPIWR